jgi:hypothetical protein
MVAMSDRWHRANAIPTKIRSKLGGRWKPLMEDYTNQGLTITALTSRDDLTRESTVLKHCVGDSPYYGDACLTGERHILSVRNADGASLATAEVSLTNDPKNPIHVHQFRGYINGSPPKEAQAVWDTFIASKPVFHEPQNGWGRIQEVNAYPPLIESIGFDPTPENIKKCLQHYHDHLTKTIKTPPPNHEKISHWGGMPSVPKKQRPITSFASMVSKTPAAPEEVKWNDLISEAQKIAGLPSQQMVGSRGL